MIYLELFWTFFKIGAFTFGGGYAMLPLIQAEVESHGWMASADLVNFVAVSESTPGPFAVNISTYVGTELAGIPGGIFAMQKTASAPNIPASSTSSRNTIRAQVW